MKEKKEEKKEEKPNAPTAKKSKNTEEKKRGWFSGLGETGESKGNVTQTAKNGVVTIVATLAGGLAGATLGKLGLWAGIGTSLAGLYFDNDAVTAAGGGMAIGSMVKPNEVAKENLQQKNAQADKPVDVARNTMATNAGAFLNRLKENSFINNILPDGKATADKAAADKAAADKATADKAAADKVIADKALADRAEADKTGVKGLGQLSERTSGVQSFAGFDSPRNNIKF